MYQEILVYKESYAESEQNVEGESDVFLLNLSWLLKTLLLVIFKIESTNTIFVSDVILITTGCPTDIASSLKSILQGLGQDICKRTTYL